MSENAKLIDLFLIAVAVAAVAWILSAGLGLVVQILITYVVFRITALCIGALTP